MKKLYIAFLSTVMALGIVGCSGKTNSNVAKEESNKLNVYATIYPMYDFAKNIGGDKINLNYIVPPSGEPHDFELSAKAMKDIQDSDLLIKSGLGVDAFADKISAESDKLTIVEASEGIKPLKYEDEHDHDYDDTKEDEHNHGEYDPHVWLDVENALKECENIKNALVEKDSKNKEYYESNYNEYVTKLKDLQAKYDEGIAKDQDKDIMVSHDAYGYICERYDIDQISITGISPNQEPSAKKIKELTEYAKEHNIKYILFDGLVNPKVAKTIAKEAKIETATLYSLDGITKDDFKNGKDYISLMEKNLETLKLVLK